MADRVDRDRDDDVRLLRHHGLDVGDLLLRLEAGVGDGDDLDAHLGELGLQALDLGVRPVVAAVVQDERGLGVHALDLGELLVAERDRRGRLRLLAVRPGSALRLGKRLSGSAAKAGAPTQAEAECRSKAPRSRSKI